MNIVVVAVAVAVAVGGCMAGRQQKLEAATAFLSKAKADCDARRFATRRQAADCANQAEEAYLLPAFPYPDLVRLKIATRTALADKVDRGLISQADADMEMARQTAQAASEIERRSTAERTVRAQESIASSVDRVTATPSLCSYSQIGVNCL